ncbi:sigma-70 family RNA polymerase sigma factor [Marinobacterium rhizophilum]|uniref:Sigma-70 family RNA polymerase sigma factor n=1 Tax=Marinobacterium rhizophilum TaxID=420402 RepID=A0ABY5HK00_9GAMM|nr:sigma-70 family RNA polymerase sigma factor [Marinobacterium rhizophilum]UTW12444.1 sigma-70 family RNA polymerase sigma factor [Marinobacterium rhizophilum]
MKEEWSACLAGLAQTRDRSDYARLFGHFAPRVKAYLIRLGMTPANAEELAQEALLSVWRKAHMFDPAKANASTWIFRLARNLCIDRMRREKIQFHELEYDEAADPDARHDGEHAVLATRMAEAIKALPEAQAQVLYLSYYEGRSHSDIAQAIGIPLGSVKSRLRLGFEKLKQIWGESS